MADESRTKSHRFYAKQTHAKLTKSMKTKALILDAGIQLIDGQTSFNPADLFAASEAGFWAPVTMSRLWQDVARTTPVTAAGQQVASWELTTASGVIYAEQATGTKRPLYQEEVGRGYLDFDGIDDCLVVTGMNLSSTDKVTIIAVLRKEVDTNTVIMEYSANTNLNAGAFLMLTGGRIGTSTRYASGARGSAAFAAGSSGETNVGLTAPTRSVVTALHDIAGDSSFLRVDGEANGIVGTQDKGAGNFGNHALYIGQRGATSLPYNGRMYGLIIRGALTTGADLTNAEDWGQALLAADPANLWGQPELSTTTFRNANTFSEYVFDTTATSLEIETFNNIRTTFPTLTSIGVIVDDVYQEQVEPTALGSQLFTVTLPSGSKRVRVVNGPQTAGPLGTYVTGVSANAPLTPVAQPTSDRLLIYGDSISVGSEATVEHRDAWARLVATDRYPNPTAVEGQGSRGLFNDAANGTLRAAFVSRIASYNPALIVLAIGTNDYGLNLWSAASFGTAYAALLDDLNAALPSAEIFCLSPTVRTVETANGSGSTLGDYRTEISNAVSSRTAYATYIDGAPIIVTGDLVDAVHPNTTGHGKIAAALNALLNPVAPSITGVPTISGTPTENQTLTAVAATPSGSPTPTRTWQWRRDGVDIAGATSSTYTLVIADVGTVISVRQTETNDLGAANATSANTATVAASPYTPALLFALSEPGFWANVTPSRLWQDVARTTPVTAAGQPVASWQLTTASGVIYAEQATSGARPTYQVDTGVGYLDFDGTNDCLVITSLNLTGTDKMTTIVAVQKDTDAALGVIVEHSAAAFSVNGSFNVLTGGTGAPAAEYGSLMRGNIGNLVSDTAPTFPAPIKNYVTVQHNIGGASNSVSASGSTPVVGATGAIGGNFTTQNMFIGARNQASLFMNGRIYGLIVRGALTTGADLTDAEAWADNLINP